MSNEHRDGLPSRCSDGRWAPFPRLAGKLVLALVTLSHAAWAEDPPVAGIELNPFECQGRAEVAQADRSIAEMREELDRLLDPEFLPTDPATERAMNLCVIAELKKRVGDADAPEYYKRAIEMNPDEPGFEMFAGKYYGWARGARGLIVEQAEKHYYRALEKLEKLKAEGRYRDYHAIVESHVRKGLLIQYQQDGLPLLPWKAYPQHSNGYLAPGLSIASQLAITKDTRDSLGANEVGSFTAEAGLFELRRGFPARDQDLHEIARAPFRIRSDNQLRLRHTYVGALDFIYSVLHAEDAALGQTQGFGYPELKNDVEVRELGVGYERVFPLYPAFDLRLAGAFKRVHRVGVVEWLPDCAQDFNLYEIKPSVSRFIGSDKLTIGGVYVHMAIPDLDCEGVPPSTQNYLRVRGRSITALTFEYAFYSPLVLPSLSLASLRPFRTPTRGLYVYGGYVNDNEIFGDHRTVNETFYGGARLEGPGPFDISFTEAFYSTKGTLVEFDGGEVASNELASKSLRSTLVVARRLINPDATPGVPEPFGPIAPHSLNWVFPVSFDKVVSGRDRFENIRLGMELWAQLFGTGFGGPAFLLTGSYQYQYFYRFDKHIHNVGLTLRMGWREL